MKTSILFAVLFIFCFPAFSQRKNLAEKLGYPRDVKLLIVHADDAGLAHAVDSAIISAFEKGVINSAAIMVNCPWFPEIAAYAKKHPELDWGIHLSLTAEWKNYKWSGVAPSGEIASLLDTDGYLFASNTAFAKKAKLEEAEKEVRAEIDKALKYGIRITHLDNHMGSLLIASPGLLKMYQRVGKDYGLPVLIPMNMLNLIAPQLRSSVDTDGVIVNNYIIAYSYAPADKWSGFYDYNLQRLLPGLNELVFHLAFNGDEMKGLTGGLLDYGAAWRQQDYNYATSPEFKALLKKHGVYLVTWGMIRKAVYRK